MMKIKMAINSHQQLKIKNTPFKQGEQKQYR